MRKTILTISLLLGAAPAALASTSPAVPLEPATPVPDVPTPPTPKKAKGDLLGSEQVVRRAANKRRKHAKHAPATGPAADVPPQLQSIAQCESGGNPRAVGGGGQFRGKYQFTYATWAAVGGSGDPASAPEAEQDRRAAALYATSGAGQWPVCAG